jgi:hypothetical protein
MQYIDVSRFIYSIEDAPTEHNSVVLEQSAYAYPARGYRTHIQSDQTQEVIQWDDIWWVNLRLEDYTFAIDAVWKDLERVFNNAHSGLWLTVNNITGADCTQQLFERLPVVNKRVFLDIQHICIPGIHELYPVSVEHIPCVYQLIDVHYPINENTSRFVAVHPHQSSADYISKPMDQTI